MNTDKTPCTQCGETNCVNAGVTDPDNLIDCAEAKDESFHDGDKARPFGGHPVVEADKLPFWKRRVVRRGVGLVLILAVLWAGVGWFTQRTLTFPCTESGVTVVDGNEIRIKGATVNDDGVCIYEGSGEIVIDARCFVKETKDKANSPCPIMLPR